MKCFATLATLAALAVAATLAAPAGSGGLDCYKVRSNKRIQASAWDEHNEKQDPKFLAFSKQHMDGQYRQLAVADKAEQRFTFYSCKPPSKDYFGNYRNAAEGQFRSDKHPDLCMTIKAMDNRDASKGYDYMHGHLSLQPCAKSAKDKKMERQWFYLKNGHWLTFKGKENDNMRDLVKFDKDHVASLYAEDDASPRRNLYLVS